MSSSFDLSMTDVPKELRRFGVSITYVQLHHLAIAGVVPAQHTKRKWFFRRADVKKIAGIIEEHRSKADERREARRQERTMSRADRELARYFESPVVIVPSSR